MRIDGVRYSLTPELYSFEICYLFMDSYDRGSLIILVNPASKSRSVGSSLDGFQRDDHDDPPFRRPHSTSLDLSPSPVTRLDQSLGSVLCLPEKRQAIERIRSETHRNRQIFYSDGN